MLNRYSVTLHTLILLSNFCFIFGVTDTQHRTKAATEKQNDLWCYRCDSMYDEHCLDLPENSTSMHMKCQMEHKKCQVNRISVATSTEDTTGKPKLWLLQRNCSENCEPGCIIIGERTKLHSCTTCCENSFCNSGSGGDRIVFSTLIAVIVLAYNLLIVLDFKKGGFT